MSDEKYYVILNGLKYNSGEYSLQVIFDWLFYKHKIAVENNLDFVLAIINSETGEVVYSYCHRA